MISENMKATKLGFKMLGPYQQEEGKLFYKDVMKVYDKLISFGLEHDCVNIDFLTDSYSCDIKDGKVSLEGRIDKQIEFVDRNSPSLEEFLTESVKNLNVNITRKKGLLQISMRKYEEENYYNVEAYLTDLDEDIKLLENLADQLRKMMITNSKTIKLPDN